MEQGKMKQAVEAMRKGQRLIVRCGDFGGCWVGTIAPKNRIHWNIFHSLKQHRLIEQDRHDAVTGATYYRLVAWARPESVPV
jgi:hypothetical protein